MADGTVVPGGVERDVVKPPNESGAGSRANNGYLPLGREGSDVKPPNYGHGGDRRGGSADLGYQASTVVPPNHRFDVGMAKMPQPASAVMPGKGAVPVQGWDSAGVPIARQPKK